MTQLIALGISAGEGKGVGVRTWRTVRALWRGGDGQGRLWAAGMSQALGSPSRVCLELSSSKKHEVKSLDVESQKLLLGLCSDPHSGVQDKDSSSHTGKYSAGK